MRLWQVQLKPCQLFLSPRTRCLSCCAQLCCPQDPSCLLSLVCPQLRLCLNVCLFVSLGDCLFCPVLQIVKVFMLGSHEHPFTLLCFNLDFFLGGQFGGGTGWRGKGKRLYYLQLKRLCRYVAYRKILLFLKGKAASPLYTL